MYIISLFVDRMFKQSRCILRTGLINLIESNLGLGLDPFQENSDCVCELLNCFQLNRSNQCAKNINLVSLSLYIYIFCSNNWTADLHRYK